MAEEGGAPSSFFRPHLAQVPVERIVVQDKVQAACSECNSVLDANMGCTVCPLVQQLNMPQAPVIVSESGVRWSSSVSDFITVQVAHSQKDGWQRSCPVTLFATVDGTGA